MFIQRTNEYTHRAHIGLFENYLDIKFKDPNLEAVSGVHVLQSVMCYTTDIGSSGLDGV